MKPIQALITTGLLAGIALAQTAAPTKPAVAPISKPAAGSAVKSTPSQPAAKATATKAAVAPKPAVPVKTPSAAPAKAAAKPMTPGNAAAKPATPAKAAAKPATVPVKKATSGPTKKMTATAVKPAPTASVNAASDETKMAKNRRDPFVSPIRLQEDRIRNNPACTTGPRCLVINQVVLKGVVKTTNGMIAMVENAAKKQYNLHEKDSVVNGFVLKITADSIVFKETTFDTLGNSKTKEVVKRVTAPEV